MLVHNRWILAWMVTGLVMVFMQIIIGGVTRLTGSGLSITKWEIVTGSIPPISRHAWKEAFDAYKGTPQYKKINSGMSLNEFKFIYFWEYLHRFWARLMGLVFIGPYMYFAKKNWISGKIKGMLFRVVALAAIVGLFGWIMVASGLIDRPWVNAYKLSIHLCLALMVYGYLLWTYLNAAFPAMKVLSRMRGSVGFFLTLLIVQVFLGGMMSGMRAALIYHSWPDIGGEMVPRLLMDTSAWSVGNFVDYDKSLFLVTLVQFSHRVVAYVLIMSGLYIVFCIFRHAKNRQERWISRVFIMLLIIQVALGITVLLKSMGTIPVLYGVLHQGGAVLLLTAVIVLYYFITHERIVALSIK
ncbi:MAG: COX15/CtaA family protein [Saprospiraceae bacterium]|nr:COX15/CtaA family protein [Saprospiraceae bacterium]